MTANSWCRRSANRTSLVTTRSTSDRRRTSPSCLTVPSLVADGLRNARVAKFDRGEFVSQWGTRATDRDSSSACTVSMPIATATCFTSADRGNDRHPDFRPGTARISTRGRASVFPTTSSPRRTDRRVGVRWHQCPLLLKYDANGKLVYFWGTYGTYPGAFWELHQFSVDAQGNLVHRGSASADACRSRRSKPGADRWLRLVPTTVAYGSR